MAMCEARLSLIVTIVNKGMAEHVMEAARHAGAEGGTVLSGRGSGIHEKVRILGLPIEPEKEIVLTLIPVTITARVLDAIQASVDLEKPGHGLAFVVDVDKVIGISHAARS